jgi:hypothetical protein
MRYREDPERAVAHVLQSNIKRRDVAAIAAGDQ